MNLVKYVGDRGLMNQFTDVFESFFNDSFLSYRMMSDRDQIASDGK